MEFVVSGCYARCVVDMEKSSVGLSAVLIALRTLPQILVCQVAALVVSWCRRRVWLSGGNAGCVVDMKTESGWSNSIAG